MLFTADTAILEQHAFTMAVDQLDKNDSVLPMSAYGDPAVTGGLSSILF